MSHVIFHISYVMCTVSGVMCQVYIVTFSLMFENKSDNIGELFAGGSVINGAYPVWFNSFSACFFFFFLSFYDCPFIPVLS